MATPDERRLLMEMQNRLLELLVAEQQAAAEGDTFRCRELRRQITRLQAEYDECRRWITQGTA